MDLRQARDIRGVTQRELAKAIGTTASRICNYERGKTNNFTAYEKGKIERYLGLDIEWRKDVEEW